jgi:hypothetical protein
MKIVARVFTILALLAGMIMPVFYNIQPVQAAGDTVLVIASSGGGGPTFYPANYNKVWAYKCGNWSGAVCDSMDTSLVGWLSRDNHYIDGTPSEFGCPYSTIEKFSLSALPEGAEIKSVSVNMTPINKTDTSNIYNDFYWGIVRTEYGTTSTLDVTDIDNWLHYDEGWLCAPQHYTSLTNNVQYTIPLTTYNIQDLCYGSTTDFYIQIMPAQQKYLYEPTRENNLTIKFQPTNVKLIVTYVAPVVRGNETLHTNAGIDTTPTGTEVSNNITLETLRCMYADETLSFLVNGDSGANVTLELCDKDNLVIDTHSDSVRTDGIYSWQVTLASDYAGFVRVHETIANLWSDWVSVQPSPDSSQITNLVYAGSTEYPQYTNAFSSYVKYDGDIMYIHWKTNINPATELADYGLKLMARGSNQVYYYFLSTLATYYFQGTVANQQALSHWRYAIFTPALVAGMNDYNALIYDLRLNASRSMYTGFIQALIVQTSDGVTELAPCHSAYWYLSEANKGIAISSEKSTYTDEENPVININIGSECKVETSLETGLVKIGTYVESQFIAELGINRIDTNPVAATTAQTCSITLSSGEHSYVYRYDMTLEFKDATGESAIDGASDPNSILGLLKKIIGIFDTSSASSHWILLIVGMGILAAVFWFSSLMRVVMPMLLFGAACVSGWIDSWWVILLALGAGVWLFSIFKKKTADGGGE